MDEGGFGPIECPGPAQEGVCEAAKGGVITAGGGYSEVHRRPEWQQWHVAHSMRGYPDVSAFAAQFLIVLGGAAMRESGTSASAPVVGAMISHWNEARLARGLEPVGFVNPLLYALHATNPDAFMDITVGNISCACLGSLNDPEDPQRCCDDNGTAMFNAGPGWDPASGLGTLRFDRLAPLVLGEPAGSAATQAHHHGA